MKTNMRTSLLALMMSLLMCFVCGCNTYDGEQFSLAPIATATMTEVEGSTTVVPLESLYSTEVTTAITTMSNVDVQETTTQFMANTTTLATTTVNSSTTSTSNTTTTNTAKVTSSRTATSTYANTTTTTYYTTHKMQNGDSLYTVRAGDSLYSIAELYGCDVYELMLVNDLYFDSVILPGDVLIIPGGYLDLEAPLSTEEAYNIELVPSVDDGLVGYGYGVKRSWAAGDASFTNMSISAEVLTNTVGYIPPGGNFSWLRDVGPCDGPPYVLSDGYSGDTVIQVYGGGICMMASAVKSAAINAGCIITETHPHSMPVVYNPRDHDGWELGESAINAGSEDLCFYNPSATTGLYIQAWVNWEARECSVELIPYLA